jgi:hypothetical protein
MTKMQPHSAKFANNVLTVNFTDVTVGWDQWFLLSSDRHHDSIFCDRDLETEHLEEAREKGALIIDCGDMFDAMQGRFDPRSDMEAVRPEYRVNNYFDQLVSVAAADYAPYAGYFLLIGKGNHETSVLKRQSTDLISNLVHRLNTEYGGHTYSGGYGGWVRMQFQGPDGKARAAVNLKYHHGAGGGGPVTRGVIQSNRQAVYLPDADVIVNGHTHDSWIVPIARERLTHRSQVRQDIAYHVRTAGYKSEYRDGSGGFHVERWGPPKPLGCVWMHMVAQRMQRDNNGLSIKLSFIQAVT